MKRRHSDTLQMLADPNNFSKAKLKILNGLVNVSDKQGRSFLYLAVQNQNVALVKLLLEHKVEVNMRNVKSGNTALFAAVKRLNFGLVKLLIEAGADGKLHNSSHKSPICYLKPNKNFGLNREAKLILNYFFDKVGIKLNTLEAYRVFDLCLFLNEYDAADKILKSGLKLLTDKYLCHAIKSKSIARVKLLLDNNGWLGFKQDAPKTALSYAIKHASIEIVKLLVEKGAAVNSNFVSLKFQPLYKALACKKFEIANYLFEKGAKITEYNDVTVIYSLQAGNIALAHKAMLKNHFLANCTNTKRRTPLHIASYIGCLKTVMMIKVLGGDFNSIDSSNRNALFFSINGKAPLQKKYNVLQYLIKNNVKVNQLDIFERTPLHYAVSKGYEKIVELLLDSNALVDIRDSESNTPIRIAILKSSACNNSHYNIIRLLLKHGADPCQSYWEFKNEKDYTTTLIHTATKRSCSVKVISLLLDCSKNVNILDSNQNNVLKVALECGYSKGIIPLLLNKGVHCCFVDNMKQQKYVFSSFVGSSIKGFIVDELLNVLQDRCGNQRAVLLEQFRYALTNFPLTKVAMRKLCMLFDIPKEKICLDINVRIQNIIDSITNQTSNSDLVVDNF